MACSDQPMKNLKKRWVLIIILNNIITHSGLRDCIHSKSCRLLRFLAMCHSGLRSSIQGVNNICNLNTELAKCRDLQTNTGIMLYGQKIISLIEQRMERLNKGFYSQFLPVPFKPLICNNISAIRSIFSDIGSLLDWILISYQGIGANYSFPDDFFLDDNGW